MSDSDKKQEWHSSIAVLIVPTTVILLLLGACWWFILSQGYNYRIGVFLSLLVIFILSLKVLFWISRSYYIDYGKERIGHHEGILTTREVYVRFLDIKSVNITRSLLQRGLNAGTILIDSVGDDSPEVVWEWVTKDAMDCVDEVINKKAR